MSKCNREKRTFNVLHAITHALIKDFQCTNEQVELIMLAFQRKVPSDVGAHIDDAMEGRYEMPERGIILDMEDGTEPQHLAITNHPVNCLFHFLYNTYDQDFAMLYGTAITTPPQQYIKMIPFFKNLFNNHEDEV